MKNSNVDNFNVKLIDFGCCKQPNFLQMDGEKKAETFIPKAMETIEICWKIRISCTRVGK